MVTEPHVTREDQLAAELRLRPERPPVTRLSRRVLATLGAMATALILGALVFALQSRSRRQESTELYSTDHKTTADELEKLPKDYAGLPQQRRRGQSRSSALPFPAISAAPSSMRKGGAPSADEQRVAQEDEAARVSRLFATTNVRQEPAPTAPTPAPSRVPGQPQAADNKPPIDPGSLQNMQERKLAFLNAETDKRTVSPDRLHGQHLAISCRPDRSSRRR